MNNNNNNEKNKVEPQMRNGQMGMSQPRRLTETGISCIKSDESLQAKHSTRKKQPERIKQKKQQTNI